MEVGGQLRFDLELEDKSANVGERFDFGESKLDRIVIVKTWCVARLHYLGR